MTDTVVTQSNPSPPVHAKNTNDIQTKAVNFVKFAVPYYLFDGLFFGFLAYRQHAWQLYTMAVIFFVLGILCGLTWFLAKRGYASLTIWIILILTGIAEGFVPLLVDGLAILIAVIVVVELFQISTDMLPSKQVVWGAINSIFFGILAIVLGIFIPFPRYPVSSQIFFYIFLVASSFVLMAAIKIIRSFRNYNLNTKLVLCFIVITIIPLGIIGVINYRNFRENANTIAGKELYFQARETATQIAYLIKNDTDILVGLNSANPSFQGQLIKDSALGNNTQSQVPTILQNQTSKILQTYQQEFPQIRQLLITDTKGNLVAATSPSLASSFGSTTWWQEAQKKRGGQAYITINSPELKEFPAASLMIAMPLYQADRVQQIGTIRAVYDTRDILKALIPGKGQSADNIALLLPTQQLISVSGQVTKASSAFIKQVNTISSENPYTTYTDKQNAQLISAAPVTNSLDITTDSGLKIATSTDEKKLLLSVEKERRTIILLVVGTIIIVTGMALGIAELLYKPIARLTEIAQKIAQGDLEILAPVESTDELGTLAGTFNTMTKQLRSSISILEQKVAERTKELEEKNKQLSQQEVQTRTRNTELERFNKITIDRESAMIKLKQRIQELEAALPKQ